MQKHQIEKKGAVYNEWNYNADAVGAFNILRKYLPYPERQKELSVTGLKLQK